MKKYIFNLLILLILSLICVTKFSLICFIILIFLLIIHLKNLKYNKVKFFAIYFGLLVICLINMYSNNKKPYKIENKEFKVIEVNDNYYIIRNKLDKFIIYKDNYILDEGNKIIVSGYFKEINKQGIPYLFDFNEYCKHHRIKGQIDVENLYVSSDYKTLRYKIIEFSLKKINYSKDEIGLIIFGINSENIEEFYNTLINLSLIHLFVISGYHFNFLYVSISKIIKSDKIIFSILLFYLYLLNFAISATRAFLFLMIKKIDKGKKLNNIMILSLIGLFFVLINPYNTYNNSFILTFTLSYFIELIKVIASNKNKINSKIIWAFFPYLSILPIIVNLQGKMSLLHIFMQIIITPFIPVIYLLSFVVIIIPDLDYYYHIIQNGFQGMLINIEEIIPFINFKMLSEGFITFYYIILFLIYKNMFLRRNKNSIILVYTLCLTFFGYNKYNYNEPAVYFLDVGQGDSTLIRGKNNSYNILIDTGGQLYQDIAIKRHIPLFNRLGIKKIDLVFISHPDYDHNGALSSLKENFSIIKVIDSPTFNPYSYKDLIIYNLNIINNANDENEMSQVLYFKFLDKYFLFCGDMSKRNEEIFIRTYSRIKVDILKVAHHGSNTSSSKEFISFIDPSIAVISVGLNNKYNHPSNEVISTLKEHNISIYRTDQMGTIIMTQNILKEFKIYQTILN